MLNCDLPPGQAKADDTTLLEERNRAVPLKTPSTGLVKPYGTFYPTCQSSVPLSLQTDVGGKVKGKEHGRPQAAYHKCTHCSYRIQQCCPHIFPIAIPQARPTELSPHTTTALVPTHCLGIDGLLPALVARVALWKSKKGGGGTYGDTPSEVSTHTTEFGSTPSCPAPSSVVRRDKPPFKHFNSRAREAPWGR